MLRRVLCLLALAPAVFCQPSGTGVIAGIVVAHDSGEPVRKAAVVISWPGPPRAWGTLQTDGAGRFRFDALPPGEYNVSATKAGAGSGSWASANPAVTARLLRLEKGEQRTDLVIRLARLASISGGVYDADGDPLPFANMQLLREDYPRGVKELAVRGSVRTNDRGEYRFSNVEPGRVYVSAQMPQSARFHAPGTEVAYRKTFYPGEVDWKRATPLSVRSGNVLRGIDFHLAPSPSIPIRGRISGIPEGHPNVNVTLVAGDSAQATFLQGSGINAQEGTFQLTPVPPGRYWIIASATGSERTLWAIEKLDLQSDPGERSLTLQPPAGIKGKIIVEGEGAPAPDHLTVVLTPGRLRGQHHVRMEVKPRPDGEFLFPAVPPGVWDIDVRPVGKGGYIKSMRLGEQDVLTEEMETGSTVPAALNIVVSSRGGKLSGQVAAEEGKNRRAMLVLAPEGKFRHVQSFYAMAPTMGEGRFEFNGLMPGKYRLYAIEPLRLPVDLRNPDLLDRLNEGSQVLEVQEGATLTASPRVIPAEKVQEALQ